MHHEVSNKYFSNHFEYMWFMTNCDDVCRLLVPVLEQDYVIDKIMNAIQTDQALLCLPRLVYVLLFFKG